VFTLRGLLADQRGVESFEFIVIAAFLMFVLSSIFDLGIAGLRYMQVTQAMRDLGARVQYNPPPDLTTAGTWPSLPATVGTFSVTTGTVFPTSENQINITVSCGTPPTSAVAGPACTPNDLSNLSTPKYVWMGAIIRLNPIVIKTMTGWNVDYTERLQWPPL
jgi:hypothetical protein